MINPGGSPGTAFTKSATTRFNNNQVRAAQKAMPFNTLAQQSLRKQTSKSTPSGPPAASQPGNSKRIPPAGVPQGVQQGNLPTGGPVMPQEAAQNFDPAVFQDQMLDELVGSIRAQEFINSPRVKDAAQSVRLKNFFNNTNPAKRPDNRNLIQQVLSRIGA